MVLSIINDSFVRIGFLEGMESLIWTERYAQCGDFEIYTPFNFDILDLIQQGTYLESDDSDVIMVIEDTEITADVEVGVHLRISGRSIQSILDRRIVWSQTLLNGDLQTCIKKLVDENIVSPTDENRKIENFIFEESDDEYINDIKIDTQFTGDSIYDVVVKLCEAFELGFTISLTEDHIFVFKLYKGINRAYDQNKNPIVLFSPKFDNLLNSEYLESIKNLKTITLVAGEGEGAARKTTVVESPNGAGIGINRRELYTDARDISSSTNSGTLTAAKYEALLKERGEKKLAENSVIKTSSGDITTSGPFIYGEQFFLGDSVQIINEYGISLKVRITEMVRSQDSAGYNVYPTFINVDEETSEEEE